MPGSRLLPISPRYDRSDVRDVRSGGFNSGEKCLRSITVLLKAFQKSPSPRRRTSDITPELHTRPTNLFERFITTSQRGRKVGGGGCNTQNSTAGRRKSAVCVPRSTTMKDLNRILFNFFQAFDNRARFVFSGITFVGRDHTRRRAFTPLNLQTAKCLVVNRIEHRK